MTFYGMVMTSGLLPFIHSFVFMYSHSWHVRNCCSSLKTSPAFPDQTQTCPAIIP